jgi:hypothetical protein
VVVDHQYLRSSVPTSELRVEPAVVLATYLSLVEIWLTGVQGHHLGFPFGHRERQAALPFAEQILEMVITNVVAVVVAGNDDHVLALQTVQVGLRLFEFLSLSLRGEIPGYGHEVGSEVVDLLYSCNHEIWNEGRAHMDVRHLDDAHLYPLRTPFLDEVRLAEPRVGCPLGRNGVAL